MAYSVHMDEVKRFCFIFVGDPEGSRSLERRVILKCVTCKL